ncbi:MAG: hypothetical protein WEE64_10655 [Dehalococcoidia bacterium]
MTRSQTIAARPTFLYRAYGTVLESDLPLPMLPAISAGTPVLKVRRQHEEWRSTAGDPVHEVIDEDGAVFYRVERQGDRYLWVYPEIGRFSVMRDGRLIEWSADAAKLSDAAAAVSGPVLGFALQLQGQTSLHGSAVVIEGGAVGLLAPSGYGKSTLGAALLARGAALLTDDVLALELNDDGPRVGPSFPSMKLWPDALQHLFDGSTWEKLPRHASWLDKRVAPGSELGEVCDGARPLRALYVLVPVTPEGHVAVRQLHGRDALLALLANGYMAQLLALEPELLAQQLEVFRKVAEMTPVYALACPRDLGRLNEVVDTITTAEPAE